MSDVYCDCQNNTISGHNDIHFLNVYKAFGTWRAKVKQGVYIHQYVNECDVYE